MEDKVPRTVITLDATNTVIENQFIVSLMKWVDGMMGVDYENIAEQLEFVAKYARKKGEK